MGANKNTLTERLAQMPPAAAPAKRAVLPFQNFLKERAALPFCLFPERDAVLPSCNIPYKRASAPPAISAFLLSVVPVKALGKTGFKQTSPAIAPKESKKLSLIHI